MAQGSMTVKTCTVLSEKTFFLSWLKNMSPFSLSYRRTMVPFHVLELIFIDREGREIIRLVASVCLSVSTLTSEE